MPTLPFTPWSTAIAVATTLLIWLVIPLPEGLTPNAWLMLAIFVGTIVAIIGKAMPIGAISVIAISIVAASGVTGEIHPVDAGYNVIGMKAEDAPDIALDR